MRNRAVIFVGRLDKSMWDIWVPFCHTHDLDVYVTSYANTREDAVKYARILKEKFGSRLRAYHINRAKSIEYNGWTIHPRTVQHWRLWDFYMKHPILQTYSGLLKARLDMILPDWKLPAVEPNTINAPRYIDHPFGLIWSDQLAYGGHDVMKKYCMMWDQLPDEPPNEDHSQLFFTDYSPESMVRRLFDTEKFRVVSCFDNWELNRNVVN